MSLSLQRKDLLDLAGTCCRLSDNWTHDTSGKTQYVFNMIKHQHEMFTSPFSRIVYCYGAWQDAFEHASNVEFAKGLNAIFEDEDFFNPKDNTLLIIDDLAVAASKNDNTSKLFTQGIHHTNLTIFFIYQNPFKQGKAMTDVTRNSQYMILFRNVRDTQQIKILARQMGMPHLVDAYLKVTQEPYQPLIVDMRPNTPEYLRFRSHIMPGQFSKFYVKQGARLTEATCPHA